MFINPVFASDGGQVTDGNLLINQDIGLQGIQKIPSDGCTPLFIIQFPQPPTDTENMVNSGQTFNVEGDICPGWNFPNNPKGGDNGEMILTTEEPLVNVEPQEINNIIPENNNYSIVPLVSLGVIVIIALFVYFKKWRVNVEGVIKTDKETLFNRNEK